MAKTEPSQARDSRGESSVGGELLRKEIRREPRKKRRGYLWAVFAAAILATAYGIWVKSTQLPEVAVATATVRDITASFTAESYVRGKEYQLSPEVAGRISSIPVREGEAVSRGQILLTIDSTDAQAADRQARAAVVAARALVAQARSQYAFLQQQLKARIVAARTNVSQAAATLRKARSGARPEETAQAQHRLERATVGREDALKSFNRAKSLYDQGAIPRSNYDGAETALKASMAEEGEAKAALDLVKAGARSEDVAIAERALESAWAQLRVEISGNGQLGGYRQAIDAAIANEAQAVASLERADVAARKCAMLSPVAGVVTRVLTEQGSVASPGVATIVVSTREDLRVEAEISSEDAGKIRQGMPVTVTSPAYPGRTFAARIVRIMPVGEQKTDSAIRTQVIRTRIALDAGFDQFRPGMEVDVEGTSTVKRSLCVPSDAPILTGDKTTVMVLDGDKVVERAIKTGYSNPDVTEVLEGLKPGDRVVVRGKEGLSDGDRVKVRS